MSEFKIPEKDTLRYPLDYYYPDSEINNKSPSLEDLIDIHNSNSENYNEYFNNYKNAKYFKMVRNIANRILKNKEDIKSLFIEMSSTTYLDIDEHLYYFAFSEACIILTRNDVDIKRLDLPEYNRNMKLYNKTMNIKLEG